MSGIYQILILIALSACSLQSRKDQADIRNLFQLNETDKALEILDKSEFKTEENNRLLYLLHKGKLLFAKERYHAAAQHFVEASEVMDKLYTKSIKEAILSSVVSDPSDTFYGSPYERSLLFYYQALSFFKIYQRGFVNEQQKDKKGEISWSTRELDSNEKRRFLFRARASVLAWDTFYKELQRSSRESTRFDHDLFAKVMGAKIHELVGKREDEQISLQLYQDALKILKQVGPSFFSFNKKAKEFLEAKEKDQKVSPEPNEQYGKVQEFLTYKILSLAKKRQRWKLKKLKKELTPSKEVLSKLKDNKPHTTILIETGLVAPLKGETISYNLRSAFEQVENPAGKAFIAGVGIPVLTYFAMGPLGLGAVSTKGKNSVYFRHSLGEAMTAEAGIEFEIPMIEIPKAPSELEAVIYKKNAEKEEVVKTLELVNVGPISDLAFNMNQESLKDSITSRGSRIAIKHVLAIISAYKTYSMMKEQNGEMFARPAAFGQYLILAKGIKESERADIRQWNTLPSNVLMAEAALAPGEYNIRLVDKSNSQNFRELGKLKVEDKKEDIFTYLAP